MGKGRNVGFRIKLSAGGLVGIGVKDGTEESAIDVRKR